MRDIDGELGREVPTELRFFYRNHRGETSQRRVLLLSDRPLRHGSTDYHKEPQWLLDAFDLDRKGSRTFALADILRIEGPDPVPSLLQNQIDKMISFCMILLRVARGEAMTDARILVLALADALQISEGQVRASLERVRRISKQVEIEIEGEEMAGRLDRALSRRKEELAAFDAARAELARGKAEEDAIREGIGRAEP